MRIAAYQAPILPAGSVEQALRLIREQVERCAAAGVEILCCPEAVLGGLADYAPDPASIAVPSEGETLEALLSPLASDVVTTIVGFTEVDPRGRLYNAAAVYHRGAVLGRYHKLYPAIHRSVYTPGEVTPVFRVGDLTFGILLCNDSNYHEPARVMAAQGATALFIPTNNALPPGISDARLAQVARNVDIARAVDNSVWVVRADVAGRAEGLECYGSTGVTHPDGLPRAAAEPWTPRLVVAEIEATPREPRRGWDAARNPAVLEAYRRLVAARSEPRRSAEHER